MVTAACMTEAPSAIARSATSVSNWRRIRTVAPRKSVLIGPVTTLTWKNGATMSSVS